MAKKSEGSIGGGGPILQFDRETFRDLKMKLREGTVDLLERYLGYCVDHHENSGAKGEKPKADEIVDGALQRLFNIDKGFQKIVASGKGKKAVAGSTSSGTA